MKIRQEDLGRELEGLNCPVHPPPAQQPPASPGLPCHQEGNCVCSGHGSTSTHTFEQSISRQLPALVVVVWGALLGVLLWCPLCLSPKPPALTSFLFLWGFPHNQQVFLSLRYHAEGCDERCQRTHCSTWGTETCGKAHVWRVGSCTGLGWKGQVSPAAHCPTFPPAWRDDTPHVTIYLTRQVWLPEGADDLVTGSISLAHRTTRWGQVCGAAMHCGVWDAVGDKTIILAQDMRFVHFDGGWERLEDHQHASVFTE